MLYYGIYENPSSTNGISYAALCLTWIQRLYCIVLFFASACHYCVPSWWWYWWCVSGSRAYEKGRDGDLTDWLTECVSVLESSVYRPISDWITNSNNLSTIEKECVLALYTSLLLFIKSFSSLWATRNTHMTQAQNIVIYLWFCLFYMPTFAWFHTNLPSPCLHFSCCH